MGHLTGQVYVPFLDVTFTLAWWIYLPCAIFVIVGTVNAVNLTDGIDGLAASVSAVVAAFFLQPCFCSWAAGRMPRQPFSAGLLGSLLGFLLYNKKPGQGLYGRYRLPVFGRRGVRHGFCLRPAVDLSARGADLHCGNAERYHPSDLFFKLTHGKRIFKMAPLHHHFEMCGWSEKKNRVRLFRHHGGDV